MVNFCVVLFCFLMKFKNGRNFCNVRKLTIDYQTEAVLLFYLSRGLVRNIQHV